MLILLIIILIFIYYIIFIKHKNINDYKNYNYQKNTYKNLTYKQLLQTNEWKNKRLQILKIHNNTCDWCGGHNNLQIHHKKYLKYPNGKLVKPWEYSDDVFMCLCYFCHIKYHKKYKVNTYYCKYNYRKKFS